ncbi:MAG: DNA translocase FtsK [Fibrobacterota bacterium]
MPKKTGTAKQQAGNDRLALQLWGLLYISLGLLLFISLGSHWIRGPFTNILGPYLGTWLSLGLIGIFGPLPALFLPGIIIYLGIVFVGGFSFNRRYLFLTILFMLETCMLTFIPRLPELAASGEFILNGENILGYLISAHTLLPLFGEQVFGAYFLTITAMILTLVGFFRIDIPALFKPLRRLWSSLSHRKTHKTGGLVSLLRRFTSFLGGIITKKRPLSKREYKTEQAIDIVNYKGSKDPEDSSPAPSPGGQGKSRASAGMDDDFDFSLPPINDHEPAPNPFEEDEYSEDDTMNISEGMQADRSLAPEESAAPERDESAFAVEGEREYRIPSLAVLPDPPAKNGDIDRIWLEEKSRLLIKTLEEFRVKGCRVVGVSPGPVVSRFEIEPAPGVPVRKIVKLQDDIALKVGGKAIRIIAPIPGKSVVGVEIPNDDREIVYFKEILRSKVFRNSRAVLPVIIGKSISGQPVVEDISKMPHLLIAGQTGAGKSVGINSFIATLLLTRTPDELRLILIDPKKVEMACYEGIPHLMSPVVTEPEKAVAALQWAVREMESRYKLLARVGSKNILSFNSKCEKGSLTRFVENDTISESDNRKLPYIVVVVDELADLMMTASKDVEKLIQRIAQLARAVGIHLIVATQRPSVDIITGPIKANLTSRISFRTIQSQDSRTILGSVGAEKLLGKGDMLYLKNGAPSIERYHGAFISEEDVEDLVEEIRQQGITTGNIEFHNDDDSSSGGRAGGGAGAVSGERDSLFEDAARLIVSNGLGSTSMVQRRLKVGYARAGRIMDELQQAGIVGEPRGSKPRELLVKDFTVLDEMFNT